MSSGTKYRCQFVIVGSCRTQCRFHLLPEKEILKNSETQKYEKMCSVVINANIEAVFSFIWPWESRPKSEMQCAQSQNVYTSIQLKSSIALCGFNGHGNTIMIFIAGRKNRSIMPSVMIFSARKIYS